MLGGRLGTPPAMEVREIGGHGGRDQAQHVAESLAKGSRVVVIGRLQQRTRTAEDGSARSTVEVVADELGPSLRWATPTTRATRSQDH